MVRYTFLMAGYFWNTVLTANSVLWFISLGFLTYSFGMLIATLDWKQFLLAIAIFASISLTEVVLAALAHE